MTKSENKKKDIVALVQLAQSGKIKALEELIRKIQKHVYAVFYHLTDKKEDVSDLTQEALLRMAKYLPTLKEPQKFKSWLNQIITNIYYDFAKKNPDKFVELDEEKLKEIKDKITCEPGEKCLFSEVEKIIKATLMSLPKDMRITLILREYEDLSYSDIAKITHTAVGTVKSRISRARLRLQNELKEYI